MEYPIVQVETKDGLWLHGLYIKGSPSKTIYIHIHGTAATFYDSDFVETLANTCLKHGLDFLSTNNRGAGVYDTWSNTGSATEIFEECLLDIDAWIEFALEKGYTDIILSGHSLGTEKAVYYMNKGAYKEKIKALVLLAPADSAAWRLYDENYTLSDKNQKRVAAAIEKAQSMITEGRGDELIPSAYGSGGKMPKTAKSLLDVIGKDTEILKTLPFHTGKLSLFSKINIPIFAAIGDKREYTAIPPEDALALMKKENPHAKIHQIKNCNHDFEGKEEELTDLIFSFLKKI